jgi:4-amino-4-deoxy-L-arabinose transferase-like glycosyltransferase
MLNRITDWLSRIAVIAFRAFAVLVMVMVVAFPAFKGVWLGCAPVAVGFVLAGGLLVGHRRMATAFSVLSSRAFLACLLGVFACLQVALLVALRPEAAFDGLFVYREAVTLFREGHFSPATYYGPGQIAWYAAFFHLFGASQLVAQLSHVLPAMGIVVAVYLVGKRLAGERRGRVAALLTACYPSFLLYILVTPYYFYLYTFAIVLLAGVWLRAAEEPGGYGKGLAAGVLGGAGALVKPVLLIAPIQAIVFFLLTAKRDLFKKAALWWLIFIAGFTAALAPWVWRNTQVFGEPVLVCTSGGFVLHSANNPESNGLYSPMPDAAQAEAPEAMLEGSREQAALAKSFILQQPLAFARLVGNKFIHTWGNETTYAELVNIRGRRPGWLDPAVSFLAQTGWAMLVLLWVWAALRKAPASAFEVLLAIIVLSHALVYCVYEGGARHHLPMVPLIMLYVLERGMPRSRGSNRSRG